MKRASPLHSTNVAILRFVQRRGRGYVFTPADVAALGTTTAVAQALSRLARSGAIRRLGRGIYDYPELSEFLGPMTPSAEALARAIVRREGVHLQVSGARAANALGLSSQVPARATFLTDGTSRKRRIAGQSLELRRAVPRRMLGAGRRAGTGLEAIRHLGRRDATVDAVAHVLSRLRPDEKEEFSRLSRSAPEWLRRLVDEAIAREGRAAALTAPSRRARKTPDD